MKKTLVAWRRLGKEYGEDLGFRVNSEDIINKHIDDKVNKYNATPDSEWRWWHINDELLIEKSKTNSDIDNPRIFYYIPNKNWLIIKNIIDGNSDYGWKWFIHIGKTSFDNSRNCWIFTDWFSDVIVKEDCISHSVLDLDESGGALNLGLIDQNQMSEILSSTQELVDSIRNGNFLRKKLKHIQALYLKGICLMHLFLQRLHLHQFLEF